MTRTKRNLTNHIKNKLKIPSVVESHRLKTKVGMGGDPVLRWQRQNSRMSIQNYYYYYYYSYVCCVCCARCTENVSALTTRWV